MSQECAVHYRKFPARCTDEGADSLTRAWITARCNGFLQPLPSADRLVALAAQWQDEGRTLHALFDHGERPDAALDRDLPVATVATFAAGLDAGGNADIPCTLIADVTVRATHQGRGLMRRLMQAVTSDAADAGVPLMALHAAHPALYERFGFAPAIRSASVDLDCSRFALRRQPTGTVHEADPRDADDIARAVATARNRATFGALSVTAQRRRPARGSGDDDRCLVHADDGGHIDGVLTYAFQGWTPQAQVLEVRSETYATANAHAALWQTLASTGIAGTVRATDVRVDDPLQWMVTDRRAWRVTGLTDGLSLRILDPAAALRNRGYFGADATVALEVVDPGWPAAGTWRIQVEDRRVHVIEQPARPDLSVDAKALAAMFLGTTSATALLDAGLISASRAAAEALDRVLSAPGDARSSLHF